MNHLTSFLLLKSENLKATLPVLNIWEVLVLSLFLFSQNDYYEWKFCSCLYFLTCAWNISLSRPRPPPFHLMFPLFVIIFRYCMHIYSFSSNNFTKSQDDQSQILMVDVRDLFQTFRWWNLRSCKTVSQNNIKCAKRIRTWGSKVRRR